MSIGSLGLLGTRSETGFRVGRRLGRKKGRNEKNDRIAGKCQEYVVTHLVDETGAESSSRTDSAGRKREAPLSAEGLPLFDPRLRGLGVVVVVIVVVVVVVVVVGGALCKNMDSIQSSDNETNNEEAKG